LLGVAELVAQLVEAEIGVEQQGATVSAEFGDELVKTCERRPAITPMSRTVKDLS
jgi:hypothetical protein